MLFFPINRRFGFPGTLVAIRGDDDKRTVVSVRDTKLRSLAEH